MLDIKLKATNEQTRKTKAHRHKQCTYLREGGGEVVKGKGVQVYGDRRLFDLGWWASNAIYRSCRNEYLKSS